jgi:putative DNA primase/helicase
MPAAQMQDRLTSLVAGIPAEIDPDYFHIINADLSNGLPPNLSTPKGQAEVEPFVNAADLIVIDNLATLSRHGKENESESWHPMQEWLLRLRRRRKSVLLVHHSGKAGAQRGTSSREDILDVVIKLDHPTDYEPAQGARFVVEFEKARGLFGPDADSFEATMAVKDGVARWSVRNVEDAQAGEIAELSASGMTYRDIAIKVGISKSAVGRVLDGQKKQNT